MPLFNNGQPMNFDQRVDRQQVCVQLLCTRRMSDWCPDLTTLAANVNINQAQLTQLRGHLAYNQPALEKRIIFTLELQNRPAPNNTVNNPVDRHFGPEAQKLLRRLYTENPDRDAKAVTKLFKTNPALYHNSPHSSREQIIRLGRRWWQRQNALTGDSSQNLIRGVLFEEEFLLWACIFYLQTHPLVAGDMNILAENMWIYNGTEMENHRSQMIDVWGDLHSLFNMAQKIIDNQVGTVVRRRQERVDATIKPIIDFNQSWVESTTREQISDDKKDDMMFDINEALHDIKWVNYYMYVHGPMEQMLIRLFMERILQRLQPLPQVILNRVYQTTQRHEALRRAYAKQSQLLYQGHHEHKRQLDSITQLCQWFQTNIDPNRDFELPQIPDWATDTEWEATVNELPTIHPDNALD